MRHTLDTMRGIRTLGNKLSMEMQVEAKRRWVHRYTGEHCPIWARGGNYPVQFRDDADWLAHTYFSVTKTGRLDQRYRQCESYPTWPNNPELRSA